MRLPARLVGPALALAACSIASTAFADAAPTPDTSAAARATDARTPPPREVLERQWGLAPQCTAGFARRSIAGATGVGEHRLANGTRLIVVDCGGGASTAETAFLAAPRGQPVGAPLELPGLEDHRSPVPGAYVNSSTSIRPQANELTVMQRRSGPGDLCSEHYRYRIQGPRASLVARTAHGCSGTSRR